MKIFPTTSGSAVNTDEVIATITGIDATVAATTNLFTVPGGQEFAITMAIVYVTSAAAPTGTLEAGIGIAAGEDDIFASTQFFGVAADGDMFRFVPAGKSVTAEAGEVIKFGIDTAYTGGAATFRIDLFGYQV